MRCGWAGPAGIPVALRRKYSEILVPSRRARERINLASSSFTREGDRLHGYYLNTAQAF
jgi:hypothetical protein